MHFFASALRWAALVQLLKFTDALADMMGPRCFEQAGTLSEDLISVTNEFPNICILPSVQAHSRVRTVPHMKHDPMQTDS